MKQTLLTLAFLAVAGTAAPLQAEAPATTKQRPAATNPSTHPQAYLGLAIEQLPHALANQLPGLLAKGQGVLVERVAKDSPAAKAGLRTDDILLSYGDQKLYSPEQLVKLVRADKAGQQVPIAFLRGGKRESCKVTLAERESASAQEQPRVFRFRPDGQAREMFEEFQGQKENSTWESFDALKLTRVDSHRWRAEIDYRSKEGKKEHRSFEGTRQEIRKDIQAAKDLPANERTRLLRALHFHEPVFEFHLPAFDQLGPAFWEQP